ncbi:MAG: hypothetical protein K8R88_01665 [Armatimonadetes bacterium]|nr:hypothetical protein [Armatimonadota bacterium]
MKKSNKVKNGAFQRCGWWGTITEFLAVEKPLWTESLVSQQVLRFGDEPSDSQIVAWSNCYDCLRSQLRLLLAGKPSAADWAIIFEYELHRERGRRPDVIILTRSSVAVLELGTLGLMPTTLHCRRL